MCHLSFFLMYCICQDCLCCQTASFWARSEPPHNFCNNNKKIYFTFPVFIMMYSVNNLGKCTVIKKNVLNKIWLSLKIKSATSVGWSSLEKTCFERGTFNSTTVSFWFNSATKNMSQLIHIHVQYSGWQTAIKDAEKPIELKAFTHTKQLSGHRSPKCYFPGARVGLESFSFLLETRLTVKLFTSG